MRLRIAAAVFAVGAVSGSVAASAPAHADGRCLFQGDWNCYGTPQYNGPNAEHVGRARHYRRLDRTTGNVPARRRLAAVPAVHPAAMIGGL
ncbi:MAG: hypothetical protein WCF69_06260 [Mycobacterium sp.]